MYFEGIVISEISQTEKDKHGMISLRCGIQRQTALASVAQLVGASSCNQRAAGSIPCQGTYLGLRFGPNPRCIQSRVQVCMVPGLATYGRQTTDASLASMFLSLPSSLKSNENNVLE